MLKLSREKETGHILRTRDQDGNGRGQTMEQWL